MKLTLHTSTPKLIILVCCPENGPGVTVSAEYGLVASTPTVVWTKGKYEPLTTGLGKGALNGLITTQAYPEALVKIGY